MARAKTKQQLTVENEDLQARLRELEDTLEAIRSGAVDAIVASGPRAIGCTPSKAPITPTTRWSSP